jgi:hypothetical protein
VADIGAIENDYSFILSQFPSKLPVADIHCDNLFRTMAKKNIGESSSGRASIKTDLALHHYIGKDF